MKEGIRMNSLFLQIIREKDMLNKDRLTAFFKKYPIIKDYYDKLPIYITGIFTATNCFTPTRMSKIILNTIFAVIFLLIGVLRYETYRMGLDLRSYNDEDSYEEYMSKGKSKVAICFVDMAIAVVLAVFGR